MKHTLLFGFFLASWSFSHANVIDPSSVFFCDGKEVNLESKIGPARNQGSLNWCFAFASADVISYDLKVGISAADLALHYYNDGIDGRSCRSVQALRNLSGGFVNRALNSLKYAGGACRESDFVSDDKIFEIPEIKKKIEYQSHKILPEDFKKIRHTFPNLKNDEIRRAYSEFGPFILNLSLIACQGRRVSMRGLSPHHLTLDGLINNAQRINHTLNSNRPLAIDICADVLKNQNSTCKKPNHAVNVIGKRLNPRNGKCEVLIRNSWGKNPCSFYDRRYDCNPNTGNVWIPVINLGTTTQMTFMK